MKTITPDPERWQKISALFEQASDLEPEQRKLFLDEACGDDEAMRQQLDAMLVADAAVGLLDQKAEMIANIQSGNPTLNMEAIELVGTQIGDWTLDGVLGHGGMATVWSVHRVVDGITQNAALKRLHKLWSDSTQSDRFLQERRILASLSHPYIARLFDGGMHEGLPWFALERIDGLPVTEFADVQQLSLRERTQLMIRLCDAVQHAHERFVVHRDLKPSNVLIDSDGYPKVLDFGVAKLLEAISSGATQHGAAGYTPEYAAPEQMRDGLITAATDVYALGVLFFELLTGKLPFRFDLHDVVAISKTITSVPLPKPEIIVQEGNDADVSARLNCRKTSLSAFGNFVRGDINRMLQTMLAKEPGRRYATVAAMSTDLRRFLDGNPVSVSGDTLRYRFGKFFGRNRWAVVMASAASIFLLAGVGGVLIQTKQARLEAKKAVAEAKRADTEAAHAKREVARLSATNDFLSDVFGGAEE
ncbi:MAG: serine/threonine-protein kinase, partial [Arenimonas sp.]